MFTVAAFTLTSTLGDVKLDLPFFQHMLSRRYRYLNFRGIRAINLIFLCSH